MRARVSLAVLIAVSAAASAHASTIEALSPERLYAESDRVVDGTVVELSTAWNRAHDGFETTVVLDSTPPATFVVPGGTLDGATQIIVGMPAVALGEHARWFLRDRGDGVLAVYGWAQGKWPAKTIGTTTTYAPAPLAAERRGGVLEFTTNGMVWPASVMPVPYLIQNAGSDDLALPDIIATIDAAFATWEDVACASLTFQNAGMTDLGMAVDGVNILMFVESGWIYGPEAAAATSLFIIDGQQTADVAMNGERFTWVIGPPGAAVNDDTLDFQGVLTHELGHFSGLGHTDRAFDTMYYSWKPWPGQRTISIDDKLGLCSVYPVTGDECPATACADDETCNTHPLGTLCEGTPDPIGAPCNYDRVECDAFCLFTATNLSSGYCSKFCETNADCPLTHHCADASAGQMTVRVCFAGAQPPPDAGMPPVTCTSDDDCLAGEHCDPSTGGCTFDCRVSADCGGGRSCDDRGFCVDGSGGGCGCRTSDPGFLAPVLAVLGVLPVIRRRRRR
jgi:MYXO-CTERM domain-containing protein